MGASHRFELSSPSAYLFEFFDYYASYMLEFYIILCRKIEQKLVNKL